MQREAFGEAVAIANSVVETVTRQPETVASVVVATFIVALVAAIIWRRLRTTPGDRLVDALAARDRVAVLMHPNPDPDAMASAMGVAALAEAADTEAIAQYSGQIRHPENRAFETVLECEFDRVDDISDVASGAVVLVDHNEPRGFTGAEKIEPYAVVDHHPGDGTGEAFTDVRPDRGSCAGIVTEYLRDRNWTTDHDANGRTVTPALATGLLYGIQSDTTAFTRGCTTAEFDAAAFLFSAADPDSLDRIANPQIDVETLEVKARAIEARDVDGSFLVSHVGSVSNLDALPPAAEELVRLEGVTVAVVTGERNDELHLSGRSRDDRVHMGKTVQKALEAVPNASGGGHARMGGGQVTLPASATGREGHPEVMSRLFGAMNGEL